MNFSPYLLFPGNCKEAMEFYHSVFGGELTLMNVLETPMKDQLPPEVHHKIINAQLTNEFMNLFASDWLHPSRTPVQGNTVCLYISGASFASLNSYFEKLSLGADRQTLDPLTDKFYGTYGALTDQYGTRWMFQGNKTAMK